MYGTLNIDDREAMQFVLQSFNQLSPICISSDRHIYNGVQASKFVHRISVWDCTTRQAQTNKQTSKTFNFRGKLIKCECQIRLVCFFFSLGNVSFLWIQDKTTPLFQKKNEKKVMKSNV